MRNKKITYKEMIAIQKDDIKARRIGYNYHRYFSAPFTYIFVRLGISANTVTALNIFIPIIGLIFLSMGSYLFIIIGIFFFSLIHVLDCSDGEVARLQKEGNIEGIYLDIISHYICNISLGLGLGYGLFRLYNNEIYLFLGFTLALVLVSEYAISHSRQSTVRKGIIDNKIYKENSDSEIQKGLVNYIYKGQSWGGYGIFKKLFSIYPFQGLIFSIPYFLPIIVILALMEIFFSSLFEFPIIIYNLKVGLMPLFLFILAFSKIIWITDSISRIVRNRYITEFLTNHRKL